MFHYRSLLNSFLLYLFGGRWLLSCCFLKFRVCDVCVWVFFMCHLCLLWRVILWLLLFVMRLGDLRIYDEYFWKSASQMLYVLLHNCFTYNVAGMKRFCLFSMYISYYTLTFPPALLCHLLFDEINDFQLHILVTIFIQLRKTSSCENDGPFVKNLEFKYWFVIKSLYLLIPGCLPSRYHKYRRYTRSWCCYKYYYEPNLETDPTSIWLNVFTHDRDSICLPKLAIVLLFQNQKLFFLSQESQCNSVVMLHLIKMK